MFGPPLFEPLCLAICDNNLEKVKEIITTNPELIDGYDSLGIFPLMTACILPNKYYSNIKDDKKYFEKRYKIIEFLLKSGAKINKKNMSFMTPFLRFIRDILNLDDEVLKEFKNIIIKIIELLLKFGADINTTTENNTVKDCNALHLILYRSNCNETILEITKILINNGLDINKKNYQGRTAIDEWFVRLGNRNFEVYNTPKMIALLSENGANLYEGKFGKLIKPILNTELKKKDEEIAKLRKENEELRYKPGNPGYCEVMKDFNQLAKLEKK